MTNSEDILKENGKNEESLAAESGIDKGLEAIEKKIEKLQDVKAEKVETIDRKIEDLQEVREGLCVVKEVLAGTEDKPKAYEKTADEYAVKTPAGSSRQKSLIGNLTSYFRELFQKEDKRDNSGIYNPRTNGYVDERFRELNTKEIGVLVQHSLLIGGDYSRTLNFRESEEYLLRQVRSIAEESIAAPNGFGKEAKRLLGSLDKGRAYVSANLATEYNCVLEEIIKRNKEKLSLPKS